MYQKAAPAYLDACMNGSKPPAGPSDTPCQDLADLYEEGRGMEASVSKAAELRAIACKRGVVDQCRR